MKDAVLIIDDEKELRNLLAKLLKLEDYLTYCAETGEEGLEILKKEDITVVIADVKLPDVNGIDLIGKIKKLDPVCEIIVLTAYGTIEDGVRAIKEGAFDYISKGDEDNKIIPIVTRAVEKVNLKKRIETLEKSVSKRFNFERIWGNSEKIKEAKELATKVAKTDTPVLLLGETGTGKEVFAQAIHYTGNRKNKPFVALNCSAIAKDLLESEMFGYKAGAFTGANKNKKGLFEEANAGTLFLDEIGDLDFSLQAKFLRVIETNDFIKPGDTKPTKVDVRIIAATNRDIEKEIVKGNFRADLYYRISVMKIKLPALRERREDIQLMAEHFTKFYSKKLSKRIVQISDEFSKKLINYNFPGNIRELKNIVERAVILSDNEVLNEKLLPQEFTGNLPEEKQNNLKLEEIEKQHIKAVIEKTNGNKSKAAELMGIGLTTLYRKIQVYGLE